MDKMTYKDAKVLARDIIRVVNQKKNIAVVAHFEIIAELFKMLLIADDDILIGGVNLSDFDYSLYDKEYLLEVCDDKRLYVEPAFRSSKGYFQIYGDCVFVHGDDCSSILKNIQSENILEFSYEWEMEEENITSVDTVYLIYDENGEMHGFTQTFGDENNCSIFSFYSGDLEIVKEQLSKITGV